MQMKWKEDIINLCSLFSIVILGSFYILLNTKPDKIHILITSIDLQIPLIKVFVIPYLGWYPFIFFTMIYIYLKDKEIYFKTLVTYNICLLICFLIYYFFQTTVPRPILTENDFLTNVLRGVYMNDNPYNCFPSIHCFSSYLMALAAVFVSRGNKINTLIINIVAFLIILSTLLIKQHVILDVFSAIVMTNFIFAFIYTRNYSFYNMYESYRPRKLVKSLLKWV